MIKNNYLKQKKKKKTVKIRHLQYLVRLLVPQPKTIIPYLMINLGVMADSNMFNH